MSTEQDIFRRVYFYQREKKVTQTPSNPYIPINPYCHKNEKNTFSYK